MNKYHPPCVPISPSHNFHCKYSVYFFCSISEWVVSSNGRDSALSRLEPCVCCCTWTLVLLELQHMLIALEPNRNSAASGFLSKNTTRDRTKEWYRERNCWSSWLPSSQGLGYPWAVFWSSLSCCSSVYSLMKNPITVVLHSSLFLS